MTYDIITAIRIRNFLIVQGMTREGAYGMLANIYPESGFVAANLQNSGNRRLGWTDTQYTANVDCGIYTKFVTDSIGYGLCQWTTSGRKNALLTFAENAMASIGDETMQLNFLIYELKSAYKNVWRLLTSSHDIGECAKYVMLKFERPKNKTVSNQKARANYGYQLYKDLEIHELTVDSNPFDTPTKSIKKGCRDIGSDTTCHWVQWHLWRFGLIDKSEIDGIIGAKTDAAIKEAQRRLGLVVDGIVGKNTGAVFDSIM